MQRQSTDRVFPLNVCDGSAKTILAGYYKSYGASLLNYHSSGAGTSVINFNMEEKDKEYVEFKEAVIRYAIDKKLFSGKEHDYVPTMQMLSDNSVANISRLRMLYDSLVQRYGEDKVQSCPRFKIRKLTPRECFRLMDVDDADIDKIYAYRFPDNDYETDCNGNEVINVETGKRQKHRMGQPISDSKKYQLAGNSIVVNCMYHIFDNLFVHPTFSDAVKEGFKVDNNGQMSLFF